MKLPDRVTIVEVGARDGLQNEATVLDTPTKIDLITRLVAAGLRRIETASFVHPGRVPQMADAEAVMAGLGASPESASYVGLVLNERGLDRALATPVDEINFVVAASDGFSHANQRASVAEVMNSIEAMIPAVLDAGRFVTVTISVAFGCPYDGEVAPGAVVDLVERSAAAGAHEVALGDTIGVAVPQDVSRLAAAASRVVGDAAIRMHFHDTRNTGIANASAALQAGVTVIDASVGGAGGCPFAPNATGNLPTEDLLYLLERSGIETGIDRDAVTGVGRWLGEKLDKTLPSALGRAGGFPG